MTLQLFIQGPPKHKALLMDSLWMNPSFSEIRGSGKLGFLIKVVFFTNEAMASNNDTSNKHSLLDLLCPKILRKFIMLAS